jgi:hypothetical protein
MAEIQRVLPQGKTVFVLGGGLALSPSLDSQLTSAGYTVKRIAGGDRFETAVKIADQLGDPTTVFEATGLGFADALAAGPAAAAAKGAILLTDNATQAAPTAAYLSAHPGGTHYAIGGPAAAADPSAQSIVGADRYATAIQVDQMFLQSPKALGFATGTAFPDALSGGPAAFRAGGGLLLVPGCGSLPSTLSSYLASVKGTVTSGMLFGGPGAVGDDVLGELDQALG